MREGSDHLFTYGTLRPGGGAPGAPRRLLEKGAELAGPARMRGRLYEAEDGRYPAAVRERPDRWVTGALYRLSAPERLLPALDRYEGRRPDGTSLFRREVVPVHPLGSGERRAPDAGGSGGGAVPAWTYLYNGDTANLEEIESGDWLGR